MLNVDFWVSYVIAKEKLGTDRSVSLAAIEAKYGAEFRAEVEAALIAKEG